MAVHPEWDESMTCEEVRSTLVKLKITDKAILDAEFVGGSGGFRVQRLVCVFSALSGMLLGFEMQQAISNGGIKTFVFGAVVGPMLLMIALFTECAGRLGPLQLGALLVCIGAAHQSGLLPGENGVFVSGAATGLLCAATPMYQGEIAHPERRGAMVTTYQLAIGFGILLNGWLQAGVHPSQTSVALVLLGLGGLLSLGAFFVLPDSYRWQVARRRYQDAMALARYTCSDSQDVRCEIAACYKELRRTWQTGKPNWMEFLSGIYLKALAIGIVLQLMQQLCGFVFFLLHGPAVLSSFVQIPSERASMTIWLGLANLMGTVPAIFLVDRVGRKRLLSVSTATMIVCCVILAIAGGCIEVHDVFTVDAAECDKTSRDLMTGTIFVLAFAHGCGCGPITWIYCAEIFALKYKSRASGFVTSAHWVGFYIVERACDLMLVKLGFHMFWIFALFNVLGLMASLMLPETGRKTLEEIQLIFDPFLKNGEITKETSREMMVFCGQDDDSDDDASLPLQPTKS